VPTTPLRDPHPLLTATLTALVAFLPLGLVSLTLGCHSEPTKAEVKKPMPRAEFEKLVMGESLDKVKERLGPPSQSLPFADGVGGVWGYQGVTKGPDGEIDSSVEVRYQYGKVVSVKYFH
jgi:hypothetical protein